LAVSREIVVAYAWIDDTRFKSAPCERRPLSDEMDGRVWIFEPRIPSSILVREAGRRRPPAIRRLVRERAREAVQERALRESGGGASFLGTLLRVREFQINAYDQAIERGIPVQRAAHAAAEEITTRKGDVEAIAADIRKTVKERECLGALWAAEDKTDL
jgi:hypothetical protein